MNEILASNVFLLVDEMLPAVHLVLLFFNAVFSTNYNQGFRNPYFVVQESSTTNNIILLIFLLSIAVYHWKKLLNYKITCLQIVITLFYIFKIWYDRGADYSTTGTSKIIHCHFINVIC